MKILILGDSQSQGIGNELRKLLNLHGNSVVHKGEHSEKTDKTLDKVKALPNKMTYDKVFVFSGGNNKADYAAQQAQAKEIIASFRETPGTVTWIGPPPATRVTNLSKARKMFGPKVKNDTYWLTSGYAEGREKRNNYLREAVKSTNAVWVDVRKLGIPGELQLPGVEFPSQEDGIHVKGNTSKKIAEYLFTFPGKKTLVVPVLIASAAAVAAAWYFSRKQKRKRT